MKKYSTFILILGISIPAFSQLKIGKNPTKVSKNVNFEAEAANGSKVVIDSTFGRLGIGTSTPSKALEVAGAAKFDSLYLVKDFGNGKVLTSDANGKGTWQNVSGGLVVPIISALPTTTQDGYLVYLNTGANPGYYYWSSSENTWKHIFSPNIANNSGSDGTLVVWQRNGTSAYYNNGKVGIGTDSPTEALDVVGNIHFSGDLSNLSDQRMKKNIEVFTDGLAQLKTLNPVKYNYLFEKDTPSKHIGLLAQEVEKTIPYLTKTSQANMPGMPEEVLGIKYNDLILLLINAVKELSTENQQIMKENQELMEIIKKKSNKKSKKNF